MPEANVDRGDVFNPTDDDLGDVAENKPATESKDVESQSASDKTEDKVADKTDDAPRDEKGKFIPKARFDQAVQKERERAEAASRQVAELQQQLKSVDRSATTAQLEAQLVELRRADRKAIMDGNEEKSIELASQIDRINRQIVIAESQSMSTAAAEEARESIRVETAIEKLEQIYPTLKEGAEEFDQGLVDLVLAAQTQLIQRDRMSPSQALTKAANDIMTRFQPAVKADEKPAGGLKDAKGADRTTTGKQKAVDAALKTPPDTSDVGLDSDKAGMKNGIATPMSVDELKALPEATLKRLRGDMM